MLVKFKQAMSIHGKDYKRGVHDVPDEVLKHKTFHKMIVAGLVEEAEHAPKVTATPLSEKQSKFLDKIHGKALAPPPPPEDPPKDEEAPPVPPALDDEEESDESDFNEEQDGQDEEPPAPPAKDEKPHQGSHEHKGHHFGKKKKGK